MVFYEAPSANLLCTGLESSAWRCLQRRMRQRLATLMKRLANTGRQVLESLFPRKRLHQYLLLTHCLRKRMLRDGDPAAVLVRELLVSAVQKTVDVYTQRKTRRAPPVAVRCMTMMFEFADNAEQLCTLQHPTKWILEWRRGRRL